MTRTGYNKFAGRSFRAHRSDSVVEDETMDILSLIRRGLGVPPTIPPLVWLDACERSLCDIEGFGADLIVVPAWNDRAGVTRLLLQFPVRLVVEHRRDDRALAKLAAQAWGAVQWEGNRYDARPLVLRDSDTIEWACEQLAMAQQIRQCAESLLLTKDGRRRQRQNNSWARGPRGDGEAFFAR